MKTLAIALALVLVGAVVFLAWRARQPPSQMSGPIGTWQIRESWSIGQGTVDGKPVFTRFNLGLKPLIGRPEFASQLGIAVPLKNPTADGLPTRDEMEELDQIEDEIGRRFLVGNETVFAGVITTTGMREFVLYTSNADSARAKAAQLARDIRHHEIQFEIHDDPGWENYKQFAAGG